MYLIRNYAKIRKEFRNEREIKFYKRHNFK